MALQIHDLGELTPPAASTSTTKLQKSWISHSEQLSSDLPAVSSLSEEVLETRKIVLDSLRHLK